MKLDLQSVLAHTEGQPETPEPPLGERCAKVRGWLLDGDYETGLAALDACASHAPLPSTGLPRWDGLIRASQTLLLQAGEDWSEALQLIRYARFITEAGMRVVVQCPEALERILETHDGIALTFGNQEVPRSGDFVLPLASLPHLFQTRAERIPLNIPYLFSRFEEVTAWRERLSPHDDTIKIGLYWTEGSPVLGDALRTALAEVPGVTLFDLTGGGAPGPFIVPPGLDSVPGSYLPLLDVLDMVIAEESWILHLAGALGRPAWGLLPQEHGWCWGRGEYSPWYPGTRLFRQRAEGDWPQVARAVRELLLTVMHEVLDGEGGAAGQAVPR